MSEGAAMKLEAVMIFPKTEQGNTLFLILIAVVLFAALSYAISSSSRGGGDISKEAASISAAAIMQFPAAVEMGIFRMRLNGIIPEDKLPDLSLPGSTEYEEYVTIPAYAEYARSNLFYLGGGNVPYQKPSLEWFQLDGTGNPIEFDGTVFDTNWGFNPLPVAGVGTAEPDTYIF